MQPSPIPALSPGADPPSPTAGPPPVADRLAARLHFDAAAGRIDDGPRRYLLMRPDVLMGMFARLAPPERERASEAIAASIAEHGADSLRAYAARLGTIDDRLLQATAEAAADLGWGRWRLEVDGGGLVLEVAGSPFAEGAGRSEAPVCAPVRGMLGALAALRLGRPMRARELACRACGAECCRFVAEPLDLPPDVPLDAASVAAGSARER